MSCNGCRVLRKGCSETCMLRSCLKWIDCPNAQGHATLFLAKFFGRSDLMSFISSVPENKRSALFQSLLFEACGRTVNPVNGALGLLWSGNWHVCQAAMETVLTGGILRPLPNIPTGAEVPVQDESSQSVYLDGCDLRSVFSSQSKLLTHDLPVGGTKQASQLNISLVSDFVKKFSVGGEKPSRCPTSKRRRDLTSSFGSEQEAERTGFLLYGSRGNNHKKLLNLFV